MSIHAFVMAVNRGGHLVSLIGFAALSGVGDDLSTYEIDVYMVYVYQVITVPRVPAGAKNRLHMRPGRWAVGGGRLHAWKPLSFSIVRTTARSGFNPPDES